MLLCAERLGRQNGSDSTHTPSKSTQGPVAPPWVNQFIRCAQAKTQAPRLTRARRGLIICPIPKELHPLRQVLARCVRTNVEPPNNASLDSPTLLPARARPPLGIRQSLRQARPAHIDPNWRFRQLCRPELLQPVKGAPPDLPPGQQEQSGEGQSKPSRPPKREGRSVRPSRCAAHAKQSHEQPHDSSSHGKATRPARRRVGHELHPRTQQPRQAGAQPRVHKAAPLFSL